MPVISSTIEKDLVHSKTKRRWILEIHVDDLGARHENWYVVADGVDPVKALADHAILIGAQLTAKNADKTLISSMAAKIKQATLGDDVSKLSEAAIAAMDL